MTKAQLADRNDAIARLREILNPGDVVYTIVRHVSSSGMSRVIHLVTFKNGEPMHLDYLCAQVTPYTLDRKNEGVKIGGCGMDMGFQLVYSMAYALFNGTPEYEAWKATRKPYEGSDPGYMLTQRWL